MTKTDSITHSVPTPGVQKSALDQKAKTKLANAVREFQSFFVGYMLKSMRSSVPKSELGGEDFGGDTMEGMFDLELAKHISNHSSLGLAEMLYKEMTGEQLPAMPYSVSKNETVRVSSKPIQDGSNIKQLLPVEEKKTIGPATLPVLKQEAVKQRSDSSMLKRSPDTVRPKQSQAVPDTVSQRISGYSTIIREAADRHSVDENLLKAVIASESGGKANARSAKDAKGLMQLVDSTAADMGVKNVWNPRDNILGGAKYLRQLLDRFDGNLKLAVASYNAGPGAVEKHKGVPPYKETKEYVSKVLDYFQTFQNEGSGE
jgi:Rod binding domain-containing protein